MSPRSAYVHVPFCVHRCGYCNFTLVAGRDDLIGPYLDAIERELSQLGEPREIDTLFFGGGTPTHLPPAMLERLCQMVTRWLPRAEGCEWSVEANPADLDAERVAVLRQYGVNRVSLGVQSFHADKLALLERDHRRDGIMRSIELLRPWLDNLAIDLIFATPGESIESWRDDLQQLLALEPQHVSTYGLTWERGTSYWSRLQHGSLQQVDEEAERTMYADAIDTLVAVGFEHYEVSNFAQSGHRCLHNERYWDGAEYFAVGPGAARYVNGRREVNHRSTTTYIQRVLAGQSPVAEWEELSSEDRAREAFVFGMRRLRGVDRTAFEQRFAVSLDSLFHRELRKHVEFGLIVDTGEVLKLSREGLFVSDAIWPDFLRR